MDNLVHFHIRITGRVQGVGFRYAALQKARELKLAGYTGNQPDGSVVIEAEGTASVMKEMLEWCRQGPPFSRVDHVEVTEDRVMGFTGFIIR